MGEIGTQDDGGAMGTPRRADLRRFQRQQGGLRFVRKPLGRHASLEGTDAKRLHVRWFFWESRLGKQG